MNENKINNLESFIAELTELSKKHDLVIGGCGCCDSPWIESNNENVGKMGNDEYANELKWNYETQTYSFTRQFSN